MVSHPLWKKTLYENKHFPDNHTDISFLRGLRRNIYSENVKYFDTVLGAGRISEQLCVIVIFSVLFSYMYNEWLEPKTLLIVTCGVTIPCYAMFMIQFPTNIRSAVLVKHCCTVVIFFVFGYILSPVLKTLTETISTDTVYAMTVLMLIVHLIFCDYGVPSVIVSTSLSLNSAIFASICLASRLSTPIQAFVFLAVSIDIFLLYPYFSRQLFKLNCIYLVAINIFSLLLIETLSTMLCLLFFVSSFFIAIICPFLFVCWQKHKNNIYGPWDEAVVRSIY